MSTPRTRFCADLARLLASPRFRGRDLLIGGVVLVAMLLMAPGLSLAWGFATLAVTVGATAISALPSRNGARAAGPHPPSATEIRPADGLLTVVISALPDAAIIVDRELSVLDANTSARLVFPIAIGHHIARATRAPELLQALDAALEGTSTRTLELQLPHPVERSFAVSVIPLGSEDQPSRPALLIVLRDMTEQEHLSRMRADFVANASHELRTPLASLKGFIETLQGAARNDPPARERFLGIMHEQASRMSRLIDDLLSLSRIEMREHVPPTGIVELPQAINEVLADLAPMAAEAGITLSATRMEPPGRVVGERDELLQVVQNLTQNAIRYGRRGGSVELTLVREGPGYALSVRDDGIGIAPQHLPRLTERFYRVSANVSRERGGTGLGLAIVKHIVARHRGELRIASRIGEGSTFTVTLPAAME